MLFLSSTSLSPPPPPPSRAPPNCLSLLLLAGRRLSQPISSWSTTALMFTPILPAPTPPASAQHQYETRIRSNSAIKPSIRLRQSPDAPPAPARRVKPLPTSKSKLVPGPSTPAPSPAWPPFPPPHVVLHPEDASSKVFHAIGRSFMAVVSTLALIAPPLVCEPISSSRTTVP